MSARPGRMHTSPARVVLPFVVAAALLPASGGGGAFLLRSLWSEMRFPTEPGAPQATLRPLWFETKPVALERLQ